MPALLYLLFDCWDWWGPGWAGRFRLLTQQGLCVEQAHWAVQKVEGPTCVRNSNVWKCRRPIEG